MMIIADEYTPVDEKGRPPFADAWRYMMGAID